MSRFTADQRKTVVDLLIKRRFDEEEDHLTKEEGLLGMVIYNGCLSAAERKRFSNAPKGWFKETTSVVVRLDGGSYFAFHFNDAKGQRMSLRVPYCFTDYSDQVLLKTSNVAAYDRLRAFIKAKSTFKKRKEDERRRLNAVLGTFTTVEKLTEAWPEVSGLIPEQIKTPDQLPAVLVSSLNAEYGLPPK